MKNYKGITLIALVVTTVVLLILAGVSISMLTGENGIIRQAIESKDNTRGASAKEEIHLWKSNIKMDSLTGSTTAESKEDLLDRLVENGTLTQEEADKLKDGETIKIGDIEISLNGTILPLPENAVLSQIPGEYEKVEDGKVIYIMKDADGDGTIDTADWTDVNKMQTTYDQFVWVPVPTAVATDDADLATKNENGIYPMAVAIEGTDSKGNQNYRGVLYDFEEATDEEGEKYVKITAKAWSADSTDFKEPSTSYDDSTRLSQVNGILNTSYSDGTSFGTVLQEEYNEMVRKVNANKGFWVGRYETSGMSNTTTTSYTSENEIKVNVVKGTAEGINNTTWHRMYGQQKLYSKLILGNTSTMTSSMIWGSQWDQIMIWMKNVKNERVTTNGNYFVTNSVGYGNYGSISGAEEYDTATSVYGPAATGSSEYFKVKNIYDLAGNVLDWTLEADRSVYRVLRGGYYNDPASSRTRADSRNHYGFSIPYYSVSDNGSRTTLY